MTIDQIVHAADQAARSGQWAEAERLWGEVIKLNPRHPRALFSLGVHAMQRGDLKQARALLLSAREAAPKDLTVLHTLGIVLGRLGEKDAELRVIDETLAVDAYFLPGLLAKAGWLERN